MGIHAKLPLRLSIPELILQTGCLKAGQFLRKVITFSMEIKM